MSNSVQLPFWNKVFRFYLVSMLLEMMNKIKTKACDTYLVPFLIKRESELLRWRLQQSSPALLISPWWCIFFFFCFLIFFLILTSSSSHFQNWVSLSLLLLLRQSSKLNYSLIFQSASTHNYDLGKHYMWLVYWFVFYIGVNGHKPDTEGLDLRLTKNQQYMFLVVLFEYFGHCQ